MDSLQTVIDLFLHLDEHLRAVIDYCGVWTYAVLFLIIFCETGLVVTPFLPGDSLLFAAGALTAQGAMSIVPLYALLLVAAVAGDQLNYWIGSKVGVHAFDGRFRFLKQQHLERTQHFFKRYGGKTIVIARFIPIVRTYAPFVAGAGGMEYGRFVVFNVAGAFFWITLFLLGGYFFGNIPIVQDNFGLVVIAIIFVSVLPPIIEYVNHRRVSARAARASEL